MADTVVVMSGGKIRQAASPIEIYASRPIALLPISSVRPTSCR